MNRSRAIPDSWAEVLVDNTPLICGILNVTPDSFSDGDHYTSRDACEERISSLVSEGSDIIDVGAESTRPGAREVDVEEELSRLRQVFEADCVESTSILFSIDTRHHETALLAIENGFHIINDVSAARFDPKMAKTMAASDALVILMHSRGTPETMQSLIHYDNVVDDVCRELDERIADVVSAGVDPKKIMIDPGIGFAKTPESGYEIIRHISVMKKRLGFPVMMGVSRKTIVSYLMTGDDKAVPFEDRDYASAELSRYLADQGVDVVRVHNVGMTANTLKDRVLK